MVARSIPKAPDEGCAADDIATRPPVGRARARPGLVAREHRLGRQRRAPKMTGWHDSVLVPPPTSIRTARLMPRTPLQFRLNGAEAATFVGPAENLLDVLRRRLGDMTPEIRLRPGHLRRLHRPRRRPRRSSPA